MRQNQKCIRDILIEFEGLPTGVSITHTFYWDKFTEEFPSLCEYSIDELTYHIHQCYLRGMLVNAKFSSDNFWFKGITPKAHELLARVSSVNN